MKRKYLKPESELVDLIDEDLLTAVSMDVEEGDIDNPTQIQIKSGHFFIEDDDADNF